MPRKLDSPSGRLLGLLGERLERQENLVLLSLGGVENPERLPVTGDPHLVDVRIYAMSDAVAVDLHVSHAGSNGRSIRIGQTIQELLDRAPSTLGPVVPPSPFRCHLAKLSNGCDAATGWESRSLSPAQLEMEDKSRKASVASARVANSPVIHIAALRNHGQRRRPTTNMYTHRPSRRRSRQSSLEQIGSNAQ